MRFRLVGAIVGLCSCALGAFDPDVHNASALNRGTVPLARLAGITNAQLAPGAAIDPAKFGAGTWTPDGVLTYDYRSLNQDLGAITGDVTFPTCPMVIIGPTNYGTFDGDPVAAEAESFLDFKAMSGDPLALTTFLRFTYAGMIAGQDGVAKSTYGQSATIAGTLHADGGIINGNSLITTGPLTITATNHLTFSNDDGLRLGSGPFDSVVSDLQVKGPQLLFDDTHGIRFYAGAAVIGSSQSGHYGRGQVHFPDALFVQGPFNPATGDPTAGYGDTAILSGSEGNGIGSLIIDANNGASYSGVQGIVKVKARAVQINGSGGGSGALETSGSMIENGKRVVTPDKVTAGTGISLSKSDSAGTVQITNTGLTAEADTLATVTGRGASTSTNVSFTGTTTLGSGGTAISKHISTTFTDLETNVSDGPSYNEFTLTVTGAAEGDSVFATPSNGTNNVSVDAPGMGWNAYISAANTVKLRVTNMDASGFDVLLNWRVDVWKH